MSLLPSEKARLARLKLGGSRRLEMPGKAAGSGIAYGSDVERGNFFQYFSGENRIVATIDEDKLSAVELIPLLREYGKAGSVLDRDIEAIALGLDPSEYGPRSFAAQRSNSYVTDVVLDAYRSEQAADLEEAMMDKSSRTNSYVTDVVLESVESGEEAMMDKTSPAVEVSRLARQRITWASELEAEKEEAKAEASEQQAEADQAKAEADRIRGASVRDMGSMYDWKRQFDDAAVHLLENDEVTIYDPDQKLRGQDIEEHLAEAVATEWNDRYGDRGEGDNHMGAEDVSIDMKWYGPRDRVVLDTDDDGNPLYGWEIKTRAQRYASQTRTAGKASGLYGYTKGTQRDVEASVRKAQKRASKLARHLFSKDERTAPFLQVHAKRSGSKTARLLVVAMKGLGPKLSSERVASGEKVAGGLYGHPTKTARLVLSACSDLRAFVGEVAYSLHSRRTAKYAKVTGFLKEHGKTAKCGYSRMLLSCYPDAPVSKAAAMPGATVSAIQSGVAEIRSQAGLEAMSGEEAKEKYPWDDCIADQMKEYGNKETAEKVCGKIKSQSQGKKAAIEKAFVPDSVGGWLEWADGTRTAGDGSSGNWALSGRDWVWSGSGKPALTPKQQEKMLEEISTNPKYGKLWEELLKKHKDRRA